VPENQAAAAPRGERLVVVLQVAGLALTGYLIVTVICVAFTGLGFIVAPMVMTGGLDTIWGRE
jgi:hypothetical protein